MGKSGTGTEDDRTYPWGEEADPNRANYLETNINATSAVGCFSKGARPYGIEEMSGNVWEWTRSVYEEKPYRGERKSWAKREDLTAGVDEDRVLRGGSWLSGDNDLSCANRLSCGPDDWSDDVGLRVVASPFSSR